MNNGSLKSLQEKECLIELVLSYADDCQKDKGFEIMGLLIENNGILTFEYLLENIDVTESDLKQVLTDMNCLDVGKSFQGEKVAVVENMFIAKQVYAHYKLENYDGLN